MAILGRGRAGLKDGAFALAPHDFFLPHPRPPLMIGKKFLPHPRPTWFCLVPSPPWPAPHDEKNFLALSSSFGAPRIPVPLRKTLLLVDFPTTITIFFNKTWFINKNILKITNKFIHQIKLIFSKNWIILSKCFTRQYHNKNKNLLVKNQWFNSI